MKLLTWCALVVGLVALEAGVGWRASRRAAVAGEAFIDAPLLDPAVLARAHRIAVREQPQSKLISDDGGMQVRLVVEENAPIRETVLERREADRWVVANCFDLEVDAGWLGQTMRDLSQGRLVRYITGDPKLMDDLKLGLGEVRIEDAQGRVIRRLEFGRKDGGENYQFVRVDGGDVFVAKHAAELVGSPLAWIASRVLRFEPGEVREMELPVMATSGQTVLLQRVRRGADFGSTTKAAAPGAEKILGRLLAEPVMLAIDLKSPAATIARAHIMARVRLGLFDGREYRVSYGVVPNDDANPALLKEYPLQQLAFAFFECSDPHDLVVQEGTKAVLVYNRAATIDILPKDSAALAAPAEKTAGL